MIENEIQYNAVMAQIGGPLQLVSGETSENDLNYIELTVLADIIKGYEDTNHPILVDEPIGQSSDETMCQLVDQQIINKQEMKENTLEVALREEEMADFASHFREEESFSAQHLVLLLSEDERWTTKGLKPLVSIARQHSKKRQKSIAVVSAELVYEGTEVELNLAPSLQEAYDLIEIDEIERDLWR